MLCDQEDTMIDESYLEEFSVSVRGLAQDKIAPHAASYDRESRFPEESLQAFKQLGLVGLAVPEEVGGQGGDVLAQCVALEELGRVCASSSLVLMVTWAGLVPIAKHGSPELIDEVIRPAMAGDTVASICLTEPHGGSNLFGLKTRAELDGNGWKLNGQKRYISNAGRSDWYTVLAKTGEKAFGLFAVHKNDPGITIGKKESKLGIKGSPTADVILDPRPHRRAGARHCPGRVRPSHPVYEPARTVRAVAVKISNDPRHGGRFGDTNRGRAVSLVSRRTSD
jgi:alkylation response protein AidB-like acyl-CoA dehydrogenase